MAKVTPPSADALEALLLKVQQGDLLSQTEFCEKYSDWIYRVAEKRCSQLGIDPDEVELVAQETFTRLLDPKRQRYTKYLSKRERRKGMSRRRNSVYGPPHDYISGVVLNSIGFAKRRRRAKFEKDEGSISMSSSLLEAGDGDMAEQAVVEGPGSQAAMEAYVAAREVLAATQPLTRTLVFAVYCNDEVGTEIAEELGISKFRVSRELKTFRETARLMLAA